MKERKHAGDLEVHNKIAGNRKRCHALHQQGMTFWLLQVPIYYLKDVQCPNAIFIYLYKRGMGKGKDTSRLCVVEARDVPAIPQ